MKNDKDELTKVFNQTYAESVKDG